MLEQFHPVLDLYFILSTSEGIKGKKDLDRTETENVKLEKILPDVLFHDFNKAVTKIMSIFPTPY